MTKDTTSQECDSRHLKVKKVISGSIVQEWDAKTVTKDKKSPERD